MLLELAVQFKANAQFKTPSPPRVEGWPSCNNKRKILALTNAHYLGVNEANKAPVEVQAGQKNEKYN